MIHKLYHTGLSSALTALGIDKLRLMMLFRDDTRAVTALLSSAIAADPLLSAVNSSAFSERVGEPQSIGANEDDWSGCDYDECSSLNELFELWRAHKRYTRGKQCMYNELTD